MQRRFLLLFLFSLISVSLLQAQGKFSANISVSGNIVTFKVKPNVTTSTGFSVIEFFVRYPTGTPAFTYGAVTPNTTNFPNMGTWVIESNNSAYTIPGFNVDHFLYTAPSATTTTRSYTGGTEYDMISIPFNGQPGTIANVQFVHQSTEDKFYLTLADQNGADLRPTTVANFFYPSTSTTPGPSGSTVYYMPLSVTLPLTWLNFSAQKQNGNGFVKWEVANQVNNDYFEVQVSNDGRSFVTIGRVPASEKTSYSFTDPNLSKLQGSFAHYRIKQVDKDGNITYSDIKKLLLTGKDFAFNVVGNPVTGNTLNIGIESPENSKGTISIMDLNGRKLFMKNITWTIGYSQQLLNLPFLSSGTYTAHLTTETGQYQVKFVK